MRKRPKIVFKTFYIPTYQNISTDIQFTSKHNICSPLSKEIKVLPKPPPKSPPTPPRNPPKPPPKHDLGGLLPTLGGEWEPCCKPYHLWDIYKSLCMCLFLGK